MGHVYDFYANSKTLDGLYMPRGVSPASPEQWDLRATAFHPNALVVKAVERNGYCLRPFPKAIDAKRFYGLTAPSPL